MSPSSERLNQPLPGTPRWIISGAFLGLLGIMLIAGMTALQDLNEMHRGEQDARRDFLVRTQALSGLCLSIQIYGETVQHYVGATDPVRDSDIRASLNRLKTEIATAFGEYPFDPNRQEQLALQTIQQLFFRQRELVDAMLTWPPDERRRRAALVIDREIEPIQMEILQRSDQLRIANDQSLHEADQALLAQFSMLQASLTRSIVLALGSGLVLILASLVYILRLESQTRTRYNELVRSRGELERLSARLVDAQETERRNISRELHDEVGQTLGALLVDFGRLAAAAPPELRDQVENMKGVAERSVKSVRNLALLLRPSMLDDLGLSAALEWQGREVSRNSQMEVDVQSETVSDDLPDEYKVTVYRLVQEALNNAVRHSGARNARVRVEQTDQRIRVVVSDDGRGFNPERVRGMGILGMEERVKRLGGSLAIESKPGQGTTLTADLPAQQLQEKLA
ncbi:MAG TPA: sensor histidine kinase [Candidatus Sulfopaludibacter sp.]|jgi:signal transduction histidine kinase|nr:sensor histidine kinase [Candidatus Sulfopaludibacter sp.]